MALIDEMIEKCIKKCPPLPRNVYPYDRRLDKRRRKGVRAESDAESSDWEIEERPQKKRKQVEDEDESEEDDYEKMVLGHGIIVPSGERKGKAKVLESGSEREETPQIDIPDWVNKYVLVFLGGLSKSYAPSGCSQQKL